VIDPDRSEVGFEVRHLALSRVRGRFTRFEGTVRVSRGRVSATGSVRVASVETGDDRRDNYLRTDEGFFDPDHHPQMQFTAAPVSLSDGGSFRLEGELTIRATRRPLVLDVGVARPARGGREDPRGEVVLTAVGKLKRSDFGLRFPAVGGYGDSLVGDTVGIELHLTAARAHG